MKTSSAKAKGRRAAVALKQALLAYIHELSPDDLIITLSSVNGPDLQLSPRAQEYLPFVFECKNQESLNIWSALAQAKSHIKSQEIPVVVFTRNRTDLYVALKLSDFLTTLFFREKKHDVKVAN